MEGLHLSGNRVTQDLALLFVANEYLSSRSLTLFENPETAKYVLQVFFNINDQMNDSIRAVEKQTSLEELKVFKRGVGHVMYEVFEQIVEPICKQHPSLRPPEMER
jgi:hypothetical protein